MAKISTYPEPNPPSLNDFLLGTDVSDSDNTKNFQISDIINLANPYKVYSALLTQTGTNAPVATVLENTLGGDVSWTRANTGYYIANTSGLLTLNKTGFFTQPIDSGVEANIYNNLIDTNKVELQIRNTALEGVDNALFNTLIEIRVYN